MVVNWTTVGPQATIALAPRPSTAVVKLVIATQTTPDQSGFTNWEWNIDNVAIEVTSSGGARRIRFRDTVLVPSTNYTYTVRAVDAAGNASAASSSAAATTHPTVDVTAPATPTGLSASTPLWNQVIVSWAPSTDNVAVTRYTIFRGGTKVSVVSGAVTTFTDRSTQSLTTYAYTVVAADGAGNASNASAPVTVTTPGIP